MQVTRLLILIASLLLFGNVPGQEVRIGIVVSEDGADLELGQAQASAAYTRLQSLGGNPGRYGHHVELILLEDHGNLTRSLELTRELVEERGIHAVICCTSAAATGLVAAYLQSAQTVLLSPAPLNRSRPGEELVWTFSLVPRTTTLMAALLGHIQDSGGNAVGLMTSANTFGDEAAQLLNNNLAVAGMSLAGEARYRPGATALTPEALWVATRQPDAVVIWGLAEDTRRAVTALRVRGFVGPIYVRPEAEFALGSLDPSSLDNVLVPVIPAAAGASLTAAHPSAVAERQFQLHLANLSGSEGVGGARVYDAIGLLFRAVEQTALYPVQPADVAAYRLALRDALVGLPEQAGASGLFDFREGRTDGALSSGLVVVEVNRGGGDRFP